MADEDKYDNIGRGRGRGISKPGEQLVIQESSSTSDSKRPTKDDNDSGNSIDKKLVNKITKNLFRLKRKRARQWKGKW